MNGLGNFAGWLSSEFASIVDLALTHWVLTAIVLLMLLYSAGKQRRLSRRVV